MVVGKNRDLVLAAEYCKVDSQIPWEEVLLDFFFFIWSHAVMRYYVLPVTERSELLVNLWKLSCNNQGEMWALRQQVLQ